MAPWKSPKEGGTENGEGGGGEDAGDGVAQPEDCLVLVVGPAEVRVPVGQVDKQGLSPLDQLACSSRQLGRSSRCQRLCCWGVLGRRVTSCRQLVKLLQDRVHVVMRRLSRLFPPLLLRARNLKKIKPSNKFSNWNLDCVVDLVLLLLLFVSALLLLSFLASAFSSSFPSSPVSGIGWKTLKNWFDRYLEILKRTSASRIQHEDSQKMGEKH